MSDKDRNKQPHITVQGRLTGQIDPDGKEHQTYRYHINIDEQGQNRHREYDNEIHIFRSAIADAAVEPPANRQSYTAQKTDTQQTDETAPPPATSESLSSNKDPATKALNKTEPDPAPAQLINEAIGKPAPPHETKSASRLRYRLPSVKLPQLKLSLNKLHLPTIKLPSFKFNIVGFFKKHLHQLKPTNMAKRVKPRITGQASSDTPHSKPQTTALRKKFGQKNIVRFCLPCILLTLLAIGVYSFQSMQGGKEKIIYPVANTKAHTHSQAEKDYHAVIEKSSRGVVITLQGPDHDEVLTQLPLGYDPIVEGNKIVHVVTPGNTLWFIAMRYIKNPYRYPELARLNNIQNPDLIYPGEKVVIQYIKKP